MSTTAINPVVTPSELAALLHGDPATRILDVRTPAEYLTAHIGGAYNVPLDTLGEHGGELRAAGVGPLVLVCQSGQRARRAEDALKRAGMPHLHVLDGGLNGWLTEGRPVIRGARRVSLERQVRTLAGIFVAIGAALALAVNPLFAALPLAVGTGLTYAGITDRCGMAFMLGKLPYNRPAGCDVSAMVQALVSDGPAPGVTRGGPRQVAHAATCA